MGIKTDKTQSAVSRVEKAICISMAFISTATTIKEFSHDHYFFGIVLVLCSIYWANKVRTYFP